MSLLQVISTLKKPIYSYLRIHYKSQLQRTCLEATGASSRIFSCYYCKNSESYPVTTNGNKLQDDNDNVSQPEFESNRQKTSVNQHISKERLNKLLENPVLSLNNIYTIVKNEFDKKDYITYTYEDLPTKKKKCTINILWPVKLSFSYIGPNKKTAMLHASKDCLAWLYINGHIQQSKKPILYNEKELQSLLSEQVKVNFNPMFENDIQAMLDTYAIKIRPIIEQSFDTVDNVNDPGGSTDPPQYIYDNTDIRNSKLLKKLQEREHETNLPILEFKSQILKSIDENQVLVIKGDTGCGKSTQVPQFILDAYTEEFRAHECHILVTEPRKISAVSLAYRIASEREEGVGETVGYHVRLNNSIPPSMGSILFCTTGIILRKLQYNPTLNGVSHVIIDEAHERTLQIDILLNLMKKLLRVKPDLKLIIMSATVNTELFQQYFQCTTIEIPGKMYPVETNFIEDIEKKTRIKMGYCYDEAKIPSEELIQLIAWIMKNKSPGGILLFVPGWREIQHLMDTLKKLRPRNVHIVPFHSKLTYAEQEEVFKPVPDKVWKIILATDIAETSITIPDVKYVLDTARKRDVIWNANLSMSNIMTHWVSKANISQRKGRAGRVAPGESYHFITKEMYNKLREFPEPEIRRTSLDQAVVTSKSFSNESVKEFFGTMIEQPNRKSLYRAVECLKNLDILDKNENLTPLGRRIMYFSLDVRLSKALLYSCVFQCLNPMVTLITMLSSDNESSATSLVSKRQKKEQKAEHNDSSDHISLIEIYNSSKQYFENSEDDYFLDKSQNFKDYKRLTQIRELHLNELINNGMINSMVDCQLANVHMKQNELLRAVLFSATNRIINVLPYGSKGGYFSKRTSTMVTEDNHKVIISTESMNYKRNKWPSPLLTYVTRIQHEDTRRSVVSDTSLISPLSVLLFSHGDVSFKKAKQDDSTEDNNCIITINSLKNVWLNTDERSAKILLDLRNVLWNVMNYLIAYEGTRVEDLNNLEEVKIYKSKLLNVLVDMINDSTSNIDSSVKVTDVEQLTTSNTYEQ
ncbi:ATP-dependent RNA helicase DHX30 [Augochlora pura]